MEQYAGKSIFHKIAVGKLFFYEKKENDVKRRHIRDTAQETARFNAAKDTALEELARIYQKAQKEVGEDHAAVFQAHSLMMEDADYLDSIYNIIREQKLNAEYAVAVTGDNFARMFEEMDDTYMQARAADIRDISERLIAALLGRKTAMEAFTEPVILLADDLAPSETVQLDKSRILAFVTRHGSANSHTAILARTMNIPALIGVDISSSWHGKMAVVDGWEGILTVDPKPEYLSAMRERMRAETEKQELLKTLKGKETVTKSGKRIRLYANIGSVSDAAAALANDAEGVGLFRSEFLYLEAEDYPTEEQQFQAYKTVAESMAGRKVIIRTLDIGADKQADYFHLEKEENPAMGYRAIRICLDRQDLFRTQLRAILRASAFGNLSVMFPMIISVAEVKEIKRILTEVKAELSGQGIAYKEIETGVMIETPAAVWISRELAQETDFFSIGTNDLTQYMLAIDRQNHKLDRLYDAHHPAMLRAIQTAVENGHAGGAWVGICGELAADLTLTETFVRMGVDELSVSPAFILPVRSAVRNLP